MNANILCLLILLTLFGCASSADLEEPAAVDADNTQSSAVRTTESEEAATPDFGNMFPEVESTEKYNILALIRLDPNLSTFVMLVEQAGMEDAFAQDSALTVFAPLNTAFLDWPPDSLHTLMREENKAQLIRLVQLHVVSTKTAAASLNQQQHLETSGGAYVAIQKSQQDAPVKIAEATLVKPDVPAANGTLHIIDRVLKPLEDEPTPLEQP
ncbi:fasciclin domain-containing protein [Pontibacter mangrovi]|uniref:Fasciclin domain-containing protein n=1 Tax=Pontibacter mangrovi TaxID=2589816 RepID=A0A501W5R0_9BACT|nr:fasciclin domain-containing protein [Pontibacter mangrovi]TPE43640.1 fasciclin domain-containing protein [Pontibacter mangrovi]